MKPHGLRCFLVLTLGVLIALISATAEENAEPQHSFGCSSTEAESTFNADLNHPSKLEVVPVTDAGEIQRAQGGAYHTLYSRIDSAKFRLNRVDFYVHQASPTYPEEMFPYSNVTVYLRLTSGTQASWWKLVEEGDGADNDLLAARISKDEKDRVESPVSILPATGDRTIPLFDLVMGRTNAANWVASLEIHLLLDLRAAQPKVAADLSCNSIEAFGVCGVWDAAAGERNNYECDWVPAENDFRCEERIWSPDMSKHETRSWFQLLSGKDIPFSVASGNPSTLQQFAEFIERDPKWHGRQVELPGLGSTAHVLRLTGASNRIIHVFGNLWLRSAIHNAILLRHTQQRSSSQSRISARALLVCSRIRWGRFRRQESRDGFCTKHL